eukprot:TRINITY_DN2127_c0_g1_i1.p1 TRINITY_DN2127_c0_g1~~TRINITY_DN2127_c0_g1_i1.p1  ORF type:complete len:200 (-),score=73.00 TRINITY_DN2127_c0_g1_i1:143-664(-)
MENYLIVYDDDAKQIGIYDANANHQRLQNVLDVQTLDQLDATHNVYIYALSLALVGVLICLLCVATVCVVLLHRVAGPTEGQLKFALPKWNSQRRKSVTMDGDVAPQHINIDSTKAKKECLDLDKSYRNTPNANSSFSSSISPLQSYYDGNVKSIVYDRIIRPWNSEDDIDAI